MNEYVAKINGRPVTPSFASFDQAHGLLVSLIDNGDIDYEDGLLTIENNEQGVVWSAETVLVFTTRYFREELMMEFLDANAT